MSYFLCFGWVGGAGESSPGAVGSSAEWHAGRRNQNVLEGWESNALRGSSQEHSYTQAKSVFQGHQPGGKWGLPGALELGGAGISDSGEASSWR